MKEMWNLRYAEKEYAYGTKPNDFLKESLGKLKLQGKILCAAEGEGRNAVYAAKLGLKPIAFDTSIEGKKKALQLASKEQVAIDYVIGELPDLGFRSKEFDAAALIYAHFPPSILSSYHQTIGNLVKPGGIIILEGFSKAHLKYRENNPSVGGPNQAEFLFSKESILKDFSAFEPLLLEEQEIELNEGVFHQGTGSVIRFIGKKKA